MLTLLSIARFALLATSFLVVPSLVAQEKSRIATQPSAAEQQKGNIKGRVIRRQDNLPLYNAAVRIRNSERSTRTDKDGKYSFDLVDADKDYILLVSKEPLYLDGQTTVNVKAAKDNNAEDVGLTRLTPNAHTVDKLIDLIARQDFDGLEARVDVLSERCEGEIDAFCKSVRDLKKQVETKNIVAAKQNLAQLSDRRTREQQRITGEQQRITGRKMRP